MEWQKRVEFNPENGVVTVVADDFDAAKTEISQHLKREARVLFQERLDFFGEKMGLKAEALRIGDQRTRWGSCSSKGTISLNWRLVMAPPEVLDYIVIHELAHLEEMNHSAKFWAIVKTFCPDYKAQEEWLKAHGFVLMHRTRALI